MDKVIEIMGIVIMVFFTICMSYQIVYLFVGLICKPKKYTAKTQHRFAVMIAARNESSVIGYLIESLKAQNYPAELVDIFVVADNCTDYTAKIAEKAGAIVYERFNQQFVGKGYALNYLLQCIDRDYSFSSYDAFMVFDADNLLDPNYISAMNAMYDHGYRIVTSYRNSKNFDTNWVSAGAALWFLRESQYINHPRTVLNTSCHISGTGFLVDTSIFQKSHGWKHHLLTEDIEFTVDNVCHGEKVGLAHDAILYDEQPTRFRDSWNQRLRWSKGFYQVFYKYGGKLFAGIFKNHSFSCYDMFFTIAPGMLLSVVMALFIILYIIFLLFVPTAPFGHILLLLQQLGWSLLLSYLFLFIPGAITMITERKQIQCSIPKRILYSFTFPIYMLTYIPISVIALFKKIGWKPIPHSVAKSAKDMVGSADH